MARAELALVIEEGGRVPVGEPAPESVRSEGLASRSTAGPSSTATGADDRYIKALLSFEGSVSDFVEAVARFTAKDGRPAEGTAPRAETRPAGARPVLDPIPTRPKEPEADNLKGAFKDLAGTFGVLGLLKAIQMAIRGFGELFFATEAVTRAKVQEAVAMRVRQVSERTIDSISRPTAGAGGDVPRIPTTALSTRVGPQDAPVKPAGVGAAGGAAEAVTATASMGRLAAGAALATAGVAVLGFAAKKAGDALDDQARRLSQFSPELARSTAQADIRAMRAEMDRAKAVGPGLARFQEDWSRMMATFTEMGTSILEQLVNLYELLRPFAKLVETFLEIIAAALEVAVDILKVWYDTFTLHWTDIPADVAEMKSDILKWVKKIADNFGPGDPLGDDFTEQLFNSAGLTVQPPPPPLPPRGNDGGLPFGPLFGGAGG
jgi:hypothetical protein